MASARPRESQHLLASARNSSSPDGVGLPLQSVFETDSRRILLSVGSSSSLNGYGSLGSRHDKSGSYSHRTTSSGRLSSWQSACHLVSYMTGSGMLCLPLALVEIDWYAVLLLMVAAAVSTLSSRFLIEAMDVVRWSSGASVSYSDLGYECFGHTGRIATGLLVHACFLITCTGYLSLAASCIAGISGLQTGTALVLLTACVWLHVFVKSLRALAVVSALNVAFAFWIEAVIFGDAMYPLTQIALETPAFEFVTPDLTHASVAVKLSYSFSLLVSGFFVHALVPTIYNAMNDYRESARVVARSQLGAMALLYVPICVVTYAVYGDSLQAPVFFNMRNAVVRNLTVVLYTIHLLLSYTVALYPLQRALESWLLRVAPCGRTGTSSGAGAMSSALPSVQANALASALDDRDDSKDADNDNDGHRSAQRVEAAVKLASRTALVLLTLVLSYALAPSALDIFGCLLVPVTLLSTVLPVVFYWQLCREDARRRDKAIALGVLVLALGTMSCSLTVFL